MASFTTGEQHFHCIMCKSAVWASLCWWTFHPRGLCHIYDFSMIKGALLHIGLHHQLLSHTCMLHAACCTHACCTLRGQPRQDMVWKPGSIISLSTGHLHKVMIYSECKSPCSAQSSPVWHSSGIKAGWSFHIKPATLLEMSLSAEVMKHLITLLLNLVIVCLTDHLKCIYCSNCTRNENFSFFTWRQEETVGHPDSDVSVFCVNGTKELHQSVEQPCLYPQICYIPGYSRVSQRLTNKFNQPWLWRTSLSGRRWAELMSWMSSSTVNRSACGAHSFLHKNHPAADMLNISTTSDCSTQTTSPKYKKVFSSQYRLIVILIASNSE